MAILAILTVIGFGMAAVEQNRVQAIGTDGIGAQCGVQKSVSVTVLENPSISISVVVSSDTIHRGETVTYTYTISNTGSVPVQDLYVQDNWGPLIENSTLAVGQSRTIEREHTFT